MILEQYFGQINTFFEHHLYWAEFFAFVVALAESLPLIGTIIPGSVTMTVIGIFVGRGVIPLSLTLFFATLGAIIGDTVGFWIGHHYNEGLRRIWPFKKHPNWLTAGESFFHKHGGKSILLGRFVGPARSTVPLIAGLMRFTWSRFFLAAVPSAVLWALAYLVPGVLIGAISLELPKGKTFEFTAISLGIIIFLWLVFWAVQRFFTLIVSYINRTIDRIWSWCTEHHGSRFFIRLIKNQDEPDDHHQLTMSLVALFTGTLFLILWLNVIFKTSLLAQNLPLFHFLESLRTSHTDNLFIFFTTVAYDKFVLCVGFAIAAVFALQKNWRACFHLIALIILASGAVFVFKHAYYSPRPIGLAVYNKSSSFPSGHATMGTVLLGFLAYCCAQYSREGLRWISYTLAGIVIALITFSRIYLGAHWLTDVIGGFLLGMTILLIVIVSYRRRNAILSHRKTNLIFIPLFLLACWSYSAITTMQKQRDMYATSFPQQTITEQQWWDNPTLYLPIYRNNRFGKPIQPFNIQWVGSIDNIRALLINNGWQVDPRQPTLKKTLQRLTNKNPAQQMPLFALLYRNKPPALLLYKVLNKNEVIVELRLWESGVTFSEPAKPLWIGTINFRLAAKKHKLPLTSQTDVTLIDNGGMVELTHLFANWRFKIIETPLNIQPNAVVPLKWNGHIIIVREK